MSTPQAVLTFDRVGFGWPHQAPLLQAMSFTLRPGQRLLLRGPSGSGKSTLLSLACGVITAHSGTVQLLGYNWQAMGASRRDGYRADHIGVIFQQFNLLPYLSVWDNVMLPCRFSQRRAQRAGPVQDCAAQLLQSLDMPAHLWHRAASELSVGQQQRVAAARALLGRPELVIADEPTSALDEARRDAFMQLLLTQCEAAGSALLFVSHDPRLASHFDEVLDIGARSEATAP